MHRKLSQVSTCIVQAANVAELEEALSAERAHTEEQGQLVRPPSPDPACKQLPAWPPSSPLAAALIRALQSTRQHALLCMAYLQSPGIP
jgi:hypothetical protein